MNYVLGVVASLFACQLAITVFIGIGSGAAGAVIAITAVAAVGFAVAGQMLRDASRGRHAL